MPAKFTASVGKISSDGRRYREEVGWICCQECKKPLEGRLVMLIYVYPPDKRKRDIDNVLKATWDSLQHGRAFLDDSQIDDLHIVRREPFNGGKLIVEIIERRKIL